MKKAERILNTVMGAFVGIFIGHGLYVIWDFKTHPGSYAMQSAPWYTGIIVYGVFTLVVLAVCFLLKAILRYFAKKAERKPPE